MATPVAPFYEPSAPPLPIPLLLAHTELADPLAPSLIDNEPLTRSGTLRFNKTVALTSHTPKGHTPTSHHPAHCNARSPTPRGHVSTSRYPVPRHVWSPTPKISSTVDSSPDSSDPDSGSDDSDALSDSSTDSDVKIQKPQGEAGRPGCGGYNLEAALGWNSKEYNKLKVSIYCPRDQDGTDCVSQARVYRLTDEHLDTTKCFSSQSLIMLQLVSDAVSNCPSHFVEFF
jgi:hypothetical protein